MNKSFGSTVTMLYIMSFSRPNLPFRNRHLLLCLGSYRVEFSCKQSTDFFCYFYIFLLQFLDVLYQLQDARCLRI